MAEVSQWPKSSRAESDNQYTQPILYDSDPYFTRVCHQSGSENLGTGMTNSQRLATVRNRLIRWIAETANSSSTGSGVGEKIVRETMLIRDEFYVGRRFYADSHSAVWFIEEDELKIFGPENQLLCVLSSDQIDESALETASDESVPNVIKMPQPIQNHDDRDDEIRRAA